jgi:plasmid maintenance system antidote protein VapI
LKSNQLVCVSTSKTFTTFEERWQEIDIKAEWSRTRNIYGEQATDIRLTPSVVHPGEILTDPIGTPALTMNDNVRSMRAVQNTTVQSVDAYQRLTTSSASQLKTMGNTELSSNVVLYSSMDSGNDRTSGNNTSSPNRMGKITQSKELAARLPGNQSDVKIRAHNTVSVAASDADDDGGSDSEVRRFVAVNNNSSQTSRPIPNTQPTSSMTRSISSKPDVKTSAHTVTFAVKSESDDDEFIAMLKRK